MRDTLEAIYWRHRQGLYTLALAITRCAASAEDAVQDAFERLWRTRRVPDGDPVPYVFASVRRAAIDQLRRRPRRPECASIFNGRPADPADAVATAENERRVQAALERLSDADREAIVLKIWTDLTFEQIAAALGEPLSTVASRYRRALAKLREELEPNA